MRCIAQPWHSPCQTRAPLLPALTLLHRRAALLPGLPLTWLPLLAAPRRVGVVAAALLVACLAARSAAGFYQETPGLAHLGPNAQKKTSIESRQRVCLPSALPGYPRMRPGVLVCPGVRVCVCLCLCVRAAARARVHQRQRQQACAPPYYLLLDAKQQSRCESKAKEGIGIIPRYIPKTAAQNRVLRGIMRVRSVRQHLLRHYD